jgi:predicted PurR-regulated permease PerM
MECDNRERYYLTPEQILPLITRIGVWGMIFGTLYILSSFFLLIFLTFVFAYIQTNSVRRLKHRIKNRTLRVILVAGIFLGILVAIGLFVVPKVKQQTELFVSQFGTYINRADDELLKLSDKYPILKEAVPELKVPPTKDPKDDMVVPEEGDKKFSPLTSLFQGLAGIGEGQTMADKKIPHLIDTIGNIGGRLASVASAFLLALLFSFLIVLDLPGLRERVKSLEQTSLRFIYVEVADNIYEFSQVLGQALEAQFFIALLNSLLTGIGLTILGLGTKIAFLAVIVFLCSFIPVAGVFISSVPICLIALQTHGLKSMIMAIIMIIVIHLIEAYILNPKIYGSHMRINPVIVLIILTIGGKLFHVWGLVLGVPLCTYIFGHAIQNRRLNIEPS